MEEGNIGGLKFSYFCRVCEKVRSQKSKQKAGEILQKFVDCLMKGNPLTFFPIMRLLLPQLDRERGAYGVKETNLARIYRRILSLAPNSLEARTLSNFASPSTITSGSMGDFAEVLSCVLKDRCGNGDVMTVSDVNSCLDNVALKHAQNDPRAVDDEFTEMVNRMSSFEQKWVVRIVLKSMDLGLGHKKILNIYHPDANELYILSNSIHKVCEKLKSRSVRFYELGIELFQAFRPMLCERADVHTLSINSPFFVETKMDGERFQIHYKDHNFKYFSRNGYDYSDNYGETPEVGHYTSLIMKQFSPDVKSCILDGEMMGWHRFKKKLITKAGNIDVKQLRIGSTIQPCFCVFDIIMFNDTVITSKPLKERIEIAETVFTPLEGVIMHVSRCTITDTQEAYDALNHAIDNNEEGMIVKDPNSMYIPNSRKSEWRKFKPDYSEGTDDLDLLIIGGYYGNGRRKGMICHFLLGVAEESSGDPEKFMSVVKVSSGINDEELDELRAKLDPHWIKFKATPSFMLLKREKPDVFINPRNSIILQVKSPEVVRSEIYYTEYTLRFPRVERIRYDKLWYDCLKINEFTRLRTSTEGKLTSGHILPGTSKRKRKLCKMDVPETPAVKVEKVTDLFSGKEICIMNGNKDFSKDELETMVLQHGGSIAQHPSSSTFCVVYCEENIRVRNVIRSKKHNVAKYLWFLECIKEKRLIPWNRQNLVSCDLRTEVMISEQYDSYGDKHFEPLTLDGLKNLFSSMESVPLCSPAEIKEIDQLLFDGQNCFSLFRNHYAYFDLVNKDENLSIPELKLRNSKIIFSFHAGIVCNKLNPVVSHVIMDERYLDNISIIKTKCEEKKISCMFVSYRWIVDSSRSKMIKRDEDYII